MTLILRDFAIAYLFAILALTGINIALAALIGNGTGYPGELAAFALATWEAGRRDGRRIANELAPAQYWRVALSITVVSFAFSVVHTGLLYVFYETEIRTGLAVLADLPPVWQAALAAAWFALYGLIPVILARVLLPFAYRKGAGPAEARVF